MAKLNITTQQALNEIRVLIAELENLKKSTSSVNKANAESFTTLETSVKSIREKVGLLTNQLSYLQAILVKNNQVMSQTISANASMSNSEFRVKDAVNTRTQAIIDLNNALRAQKEAEEVLAMRQTRAAADALRAAKRETEAAKERLKPYNVLVAKQREAQSVLRNLIASEKASTAEIKKAQAEYDRLTKKIKEANGAQKQLNSTNKTTESIFGSLIKGFGAIKASGIALDIAKDVYENIKSFDSLNFSIKQITQTTIDYENSQKFLITLTEKYGVELLSTANRWIKFLTAARQSGLALKDTEDIFRSVTKAAAVLGLQTDELQSVYLALEQMLSKGKVTTEELRRQLGERLPGAVGIMAAAVGKTIPEFEKMLKKGEILSADALPKFARALEQAYGIEHVENIRTLTAEQGRLTAAFQLFIKNVGEGDGVVKKVIGGWLSLMTGLVKRIDHLTMSSGQKVRWLASSFEEFKRIEISNEKQIEALREQGYEKSEDLSKDIFNARVALAKAIGDEESRIAEENLNKLLLIQSKANDKQAELLVQYGLDNVKKYEERYEEQLKIYNKYQEEMSKPVNNTNSWSTPFSAARSILSDKSPAEGFRDTEFTSSIDIEGLEKTLASMEAMYNLTRKFAETSKIKLIEDDEDGKIKRVWQELKNLNEVRDLSDEISVRILKSNIDFNKRLIDSDAVSNAERVKLYKENAEYRISIAETTYNSELDKLKVAKEKEIADLILYDKRVQASKSFTDENKIKSAERTGTQIEAINKRFAQQEILLYQNRSEAIFNSAVELEKDLAKNLKDANDIKLSINKDVYNKQIIAIKEVYNQSEKTNKDRIQMEKDLERVALEAAESQIRAQIALLKASIDASTQSSEHIDSIIRKINELEASINNLKPKNKGEWIEFWNTILDLASEYNKAISDLVGASFDRKIENINAEIEAEKTKYETLHELAENDAAQQETLRVNRDRRIEQLEKKRLKEEQKAAKAKKAFALAGIAVDTASAIMGIWAQVPKFDFGISAGLLTAFVAGLGLVQAAAVLAAPIPQYAEGGEITKDEIAMINDANVQEYVKRGNKILTTDTKDAIVQLKRGDTVYKNYDEMIKNNNHIPNLYSSKPINENEFNRLLSTVSSGIEKGFKRARIDNKVVINNNSSDYRESLSKWS